MAKLAAFIMAHDHTNIFMVQRAKDGKWGLPGGKVEIGESILNAAIRECEEEIDYTFSREDLHYKGSHKIRKDYYSVLFEAPISTLALNGMVYHYLRQEAICADESVGFALISIDNTDFSKMDLAPTLLEELVGVFGSRIKK